LTTEKTLADELGFAFSTACDVVAVGGATACRQTGAAAGWTVLGSGAGASATYGRCAAASGCADGKIIGEAHAEEPDLRRDGQRLLDLCARAVRPEEGCRGNGVSGWRRLSGPQRQSPGFERSGQFDRSGEDSRDDCRVHQSGRYFGLAGHANL